MFQKVRQGLGRVLPSRSVEVRSLRVLDRSRWLRFIVLGSVLLERSIEHMRVAARMIM